MIEISPRWQAALGAGLCVVGGGLTQHGGVLAIFGFLLSGAAGVLIGTAVARARHVGD